MRQVLSGYLNIELSQLEIVTTVRRTKLLYSGRYYSLTLLCCTLVHMDLYSSHSLIFVDNSRITVCKPLERINTSDITFQVRVNHVRRSNSSGA